MRSWKFSELLFGTNFFIISIFSNIPISFVNIERFDDIYKGIRLSNTKTSWFKETERFKK